MGLDRYKIWAVALITTALTLLVPQLFPKARLLFFAPLLVVLLYQKSLSTCLWWAFSCGLLIDLLSSGDRLAIHALNYCIAAGCLYTLRKNFFADSLSTLPLMTLIFSLASSLIELLLAHLFHAKIPFSWGSIASHLLFMPLFDALYAFTLFTLPLFLFGKKQRPGKEYFMN